MTRTRKNRRYSHSAVIRAAYLAGSGATAEEIAEALGSGSAQGVYALLRRQGMRLVPKNRGQVSFPLVISRDVMGTAERYASSRGVDPCWLIGRLVEECIRDRVRISELIARMEDL